MTIRRVVLVLGGGFAVGGAAFALGWWNSAESTGERKDAFAGPGFSQQDSPEATVPERPAEAAWTRRVTTEAYIPLAGAASVAEIAKFTDGAATVEIHGVAGTFRAEGQRRPATAADVEDFAKHGKRIAEGQPIGPLGFLMTRFDATVRWTDGGVERATIIVQGGVEGETLYELAGVPIPEVGKTYFFFLRRTADGLVPEAVQFILDGERLAPFTFPQSGLSRRLAGVRVSDATPEIASAFASR